MNAIERAQRITTHLGHRRRAHAWPATGRRALIASGLMTRPPTRRLQHLPTITITATDSDSDSDRAAAAVAAAAATA